jgi:hypothetical protein
MNSIKRTTLSLPKNDVTLLPEDDAVVIDFFEILLPCRRFNISYKVSEKGGVSLTSEFLLRLLYSIDGMDESEIADFFGFDNREFIFVMTEVISRDYVFRKDGKAWLTSTGRQLFIDNDTVPQVLKVEKRNKKVGFDLLSLCTQELGKLDKFTSQLHELPILDVELLANATKQIPKSFQKHFSEISLSRGGVSAEKQEYLYSVDTVSAEQRFQAIVPVYITISADKPSSPEIDLSHWKVGYELDDRRQVIESISSHINGLEVFKRNDDTFAYELLYALAPEFFKDFMRKDGLSVERYFKSTFTRVGDLRIDRPTVPILGSLFIPNNNYRLIDAVKYGLKSHNLETPIPKNLYWLLPSTHWGYTQVLPVTLDSIKHKILSKEGAQSDAFEFIALTQSSPARHIQSAFTQAKQLNINSLIPPSLEILYIPDVLVAVLVHTPIKSQKGFPVPLGFLSFDVTVISRTKELMKKYELIPEKE